MATAYPQTGNRGTGRRKEAIARVRLIPGTGKVFVNGRSMDDYFGFRKALQIPIMQPLVVAGVQGQYDVIANVCGGGISGQADAIKLGVARALKEMNLSEYGVLMRQEGFLTRDPRAKERKKYGRHRARKKPQFSKR